MRCLTKTCRAVAAACLLLAASAAGAATPAAADDALAALQAAYTRAVAPGEQADSYRDLFATVFQRVQRSHAREVDPSGLAAAALKVLEPLPPGAGDPPVVFRNAVNAALRTLDPYSRYLDPQAQSAERSSLSGSFGGLGLELETSDGVIRVVTPLPGSPAERAGMQPGDLILGVDDQPLQGIPLTDAIERLRGQPGTPVAITIRRTGVPAEFKVSVTRDTIRRQIVRWSMEGEVLVLRIGSFMGAVAAPLEQAIGQAMAGHAPRAVVLDMRGNPGGLVREAVLTADAFLAKGEIVSLRGRTPGNQRNWQADASELLPGLPMLVLIDGRSASAAELVAAALQENGRAKVMGQRSFGKGTVQATYPLGADKGALRLTTAIYHGPSGRTVQQVGVVPDIELLGPAPNRPARADAAQDELQATADPPRVPAARLQQSRCPPLLKTPDPALACAVAYLQGGDGALLAPAAR